MAAYVVSDIHGRLKTFDRLLDKVSPAEEDKIFVLGDMVDRGPDPAGVMRLCRSFSNATVLVGNHEMLMLDFFQHPHNPTSTLNWAINGGLTTAKDLAKLPQDERTELLEWVENLPRFALTKIGDQQYVLVHAGIYSDLLPENARDNLQLAMMQQDQEELVWVREGYLDRPTGLVDKEGKGPIIVAGHTPTVLAETLADVCDREALNEDQRCQMLSLGATPETGMVADRWVIDCGAGSVPDHGRLLMLRLDDKHEVYENVLEED